MRVSLLLLTIDRANKTKHCFGGAMQKAEYSFDLCIADNGSTEPEIFEWCETLKPKIYLKHGYNKGTTQALNELIALNPADAYVFIGNDIEMPRGWLREFVRYAKAIDNAGMIGMDWRGLAKSWKQETINGLNIIPATNIFGPTFITQKALDKIGSFCEDYGTYGLWDSDCAIRCSIAGLQNFYIPNFESEHKGNDVGKGTEYRKMKDLSLEKAQPIFNENIKRYNETKLVYLQNKNKQ